MLVLYACDVDHNPGTSRGVYGRGVSPGGRPSPRAHYVVLFLNVTELRPMYGAFSPEGVEFHSATRFGGSDMTMTVTTLCDGVLIDSLID